MDTVDGGEVRSDVCLGDGLGDAECCLVGVIRFPGRSEIPDHPEYDVREVNLLTDDSSLRRPILRFDHSRTTYPRPSIVELLEPFSFGELFPSVGSDEFALGESTSITSEFCGSQTRDRRV